MKKTLDVFLPYKGERNYVHGTDLVNTILKGFGEGSVENFSISFSGLIVEQNCRLFYSAQELSSESSKKCKGKCEVDGSQVYFGVQPLSDYCGEIRRIAYDESIVMKRSIMEEKSIFYAEKSPYSFIENVVALTKRLHQKRVSSDGQWLFVKLNLDCFSYESTSLRIKLVMTSSTRLTKSIIYSENREIGEIYFSLVKL